MVISKANAGQLMPDLRSENCDSVAKTRATGANDTSVSHYWKGSVGKICLNQAGRTLNSSQ